MKNLLKSSTLIILAATFASCKSNQETTTVSNNDKHPDVAEMFAKMDTNNDGKISAIEAKGKLRENFRKRDSNNDGYITRDELSRKK